MSEVFSGTPVITSVRIDGADGRMVEYHIAGQDLTDVAEAVKKALAALPAYDEQGPKSSPAPKKSRKARRTKAQIAADAVIETAVAAPSKRDAEKEPAGGVWP